jgi:hypothetical protein
MARTHSAIRAGKYVEAIYKGMADDAVRAQRKVAEAYYKNEAWEVGRVLAGWGDGAGLWNVPSHG